MEHACFLLVPAKMKPATSKERGPKVKRKEGEKKEKREINKKTNTFLLSFSIIII
jgi:hypothetical protein